MSPDTSLELLHIRVFLLDIEGVLSYNNQSIVLNRTLPESKLKKTYKSITYHKVYKSIDAGIILFFHKDGEANLEDILTRNIPSRNTHDFNVQNIWIQCFKYLEIVIILRYFQTSEYPSMRTVKNMVAYYNIHNIPMY